MTRFDYPDTGPRNIYELDVPKTAVLIDRVPKGDLARIIAAQRADRKRFDPYDTIVVQQTEGVRRVTTLGEPDGQPCASKGQSIPRRSLLSAKKGLPSDARCP